MNVSIDYEGAPPLYSPLKKQKHKKKKQKLGFPIKDFGNDKKGGHS